MVCLVPRGLSGGSLTYLAEAMRCRADPSIAAAVTGFRVQAPRAAAAGQLGRSAGKAEAL